MKTKKLFFLSVLCISMGVAAQQANLSYEPVSGKKYAMETNLTTNVNQNMGGMEIKADIESVITGTFEIEEVAANGDFKALTLLKSIDMSMAQSGQQPITRSSEINMILRTTYDKTGKMLKNELVKSSPDSTVAQIMAGLGDLAAKGVVLPILPGRPADKGETWTINTNDTVPPSASTPFELQTRKENNCTFSGIETRDGEELLKIEISGPVKVAGQGSQMGMDMTIEGSGMSQTNYLLRSESRIPAYVEDKIGLDMNILVSGAQNMALPMTQNVTTTTVFKEIRE